MHGNIDVAKAIQEVAISSKENAQKSSEIGAGQALRHTQAEVLAGTEEELANNEQSFAIAIPPKRTPIIGHRFHREDQRGHSAVAVS